MNTFSVVVGDWSDDGHGKTATYYIETNMNYEGVQKAFNRGVSKIGVDITKFCKEYENFLIPKEEFKKFKDFLFEPENYDYPNKTIKQYGDSDDYFGLWHDSYFGLWISTVKAGLEKEDFVNVVETEMIGIGGYGLF